MHKTKNPKSTNGMTKRTSHRKESCRDEFNIVKCGVATLEKMRDMFGAALGTRSDPCTVPLLNAGCSMDPRCRSKECPYRGDSMPPNLFQIFCKNSAKRLMRTTYGNRRNQNSTRMHPGEVSLRGDRMIIHLGGKSSNHPAPVDENGRPVGHMYYNMRPTAAGLRNGDQRPTGWGNGKLTNRGDEKPRSTAWRPEPRNVIQVLPPLQPSADLAVGPVTGLPVSDDEDVFLLQVGKQYYKNKKKTRLQLEVRLPKQQAPKRIDVDVQVLATDLKEKGDKKEGKKVKGKKSGKKDSKKPGKKGSKKSEEKKEK